MSVCYMNTCDLHLLAFEMYAYHVYIYIYKITYTCRSIIYFSLHRHLRFVYLFIYLCVYLFLSIYYLRVSSCIDLSVSDSCKYTYAVPARGSSVPRWSFPQDFPHISTEVYPRNPWRPPLSPLQFGLQKHQPLPS